MALCEVCGIRRPACRALQSISAVAALHSHGVTHRDLRLENFLLFGNVVKIADLGLSSDHSIMYTLEVQTWWYRAPELFLRQQPYTSVVDLWALGMLLMHVLIGKAPYELEEAEMMAHIFRSRNVPIPYSAAQLVMYLPSKCAQFPPLKRWHDLLVQINPVYRIPIATLANEVRAYANASALVTSASETQDTCNDAPCQKQKKKKESKRGGKRGRAHEDVV